MRYQITRHLYWNLNRFEFMNCWTGYYWETGNELNYRSKAASFFRTFGINWDSTGWATRIEINYGREADSLHSGNWHQLGHYWATGNELNYGRVAAALCSGNYTYSRATCYYGHEAASLFWATGINCWMSHYWETNRNEINYRSKAASFHSDIWHQLGRYLATGI